MDNVKLFQFLAIALASWVNRRQQAIIDYLIEESRILEQQLDGNRFRLSDDDRRCLAAKAKPFGWKVVDEVASLVTRDTLLAWYRNLVARRHDPTSRTAGRHAEFLLP